MPIYLLLNIFTLSGPLLFSFEGNIALYKKWPRIIPAILISALLFIVWDIAFTEMGVWGFNPEYLVGIYCFGLPLEEILFFITIPYACIFIYEVVKFYLRDKLPPAFGKWAGYGLLAAIPFLWLQNPDGWYTAVCLGLATVLLILQHLVFRPKWLNHWYLAYFIHLVPFLLVNGVLTYLPVVWYNDLENTGHRLVSIPLDDLFYSLGLFLLNASLYEYFESRHKEKKAKPATGARVPV